MDILLIGLVVAFTIGVVILTKHLLVKKHSRDKIFVVTTALINLFLVLPLVFILSILLATTETSFSEIVTIFTFVQGLPLVLFIISLIHYKVTKVKG